MSQAPKDGVRTRINPKHNPPRIIILALTLITLNMSLVGGCNSDTKTGQDEIIYEEDGKHIRFIYPLSGKELTNFVQEEELTVQEIRTNTGGIQSGYTLKSDTTLDQALIRFEKKHLEFLQNSQAELKKSIAKAMNEGEQDEVLVLANLRDQLFEAEDRIISDGLLISSLNLTPEKHSQKTSSLNTNSFTEKRANREVIPQSLYYESWAPFYGYSKVTTGMAFNIFYFDDLADTNKYFTYGHETRIYDSDFARYDGYWSSNLPYPYYYEQETGTGKNFIVGSTQTSELKTYVRYYTYVSLRGEGASESPVMIRGQKGVRFPIWCRDGDCIYQDDTTGTYTNFIAPNTGDVWIY